MRLAADTGEVAVGMFHRHGHAVPRFLYRLTRNPAAADAASPARQVEGLDLQQHDFALRVTTERLW